MRRVMRRIFGGVLFAFAVSSAWADAVLLNTTDVVIEARSPAAIQQALPEALQQVLVKMSGNTGVMTLPAIQKAVPHVNQLVESYRYTTQQSASGESQVGLHVVFDQQALERLLRGAGQAIWSEQRPLTLVWVAAPQGIETTVLASTDRTDLVAALDEQAELRGVPIMLPTMDLKDQSSTPVAAMMPSSQGLAELAKRYQVSSVLAGVITPASDGKELAEWRWVLNGSPMAWQSTADSATQAISEGMDKAADMMAGQLATLSTSPVETQLVLQVSGVEDLNDYVHVVDALRRLDKVSQVHVADMENSTLVVDLRVAGQQDELVSELRAVKHLSTEAESANLGTPADLYYHWVSQAKPYDPGHDDTVVDDSDDIMTNGLTQ